MPPRPRPRPANRQASDSAQPAGTSSITGRVVPVAKTDRDLELDKGDEFFLRNRNRTARDWQRLDRLEKERTALSSDINTDAEEVSDSSASHRGSPRKKRKAREGAQRDDTGLPKWTRETDMSLLTSDDDDGLEIIDVVSQDEHSDSGAKKRAEKKRQRSRSRSLTPPPQLSMQQIMRIRNVVNEALGPKPRADSPTNELYDDSMDTIVLDEDLLSIAREAQKHAKSTFPERGGGPENVTIKLHWQPHPLSGHGGPTVLTFQMKRHDTFHALFDQVAKAAGVPAQSLVVSHNSSRVYASATPHSLKVWAETQLDASDNLTFEYLRTHRHARASPTDGRARSHSPTESMNDGESETDIHSAAEDDDDDNETFKLVVRSGVTKDVTLTVRPTTTCGAIVKAFLKRAGIADKYPEGKSSRRKSAAGGPRLMIDGDRMDPDTPISTAELDDGDQVEVTGL
ncbi:hypothetical protein BC834DRAFT_863466 [Gloeopeniophorella convolvens]|nr:hypothetical protein BC834DRAFT_863466 [Gloeopeniophorella convolvens]